MDSGKIIPPLDELIGYLDKIPLIIESLPTIPVRIILEEINEIHGEVKQIYYRNNLKVNVRLDHIKRLAQSKNIQKIKFDGNIQLLNCSYSKECYVLDKYLEEILLLSESTPVIIHVSKLLEKKDENIISNLCKTYKQHGKIARAYSANIALRRIEKLAPVAHISSIQYDRSYPKTPSTKIFLPSTFW